MFSSDMGNTLAVSDPPDSLATVAANSSPPSTRYDPGGWPMA